MPSLHAAQQPSGRDAAALETEVNLLKAELKATKRRLENDVACAKEDALGVMRATGNTHAHTRAHAHAEVGWVVMGVVMV